MISRTLAPPAIVALAASLLLTTGCLKFDLQQLVGLAPQTPAESAPVSDDPPTVYADPVYADPVHADPVHADPAPSDAERTGSTTFESLPVEAPAVDPVEESQVHSDTPPAIAEEPLVADDPQRAQASNGGTGSEDVAFELRTGTALPQTLPSGTALGVSVSYEFVGRRKTAVRYLLVVERGGGPSAALEFTPKQTGTLATFIPGWQPQEGPFSCHIVEVSPNGQRRKVSRDEWLR
jgi:hypothetical protein